MITYIIAAQTADGFIAKNSHHPVDWTSKEDKKFFSEMTKRAGVIVMGQNTFETMVKPLPLRLNIVYSKNKEYKGVEVTKKDPANLLSDLQKRGYKEVAICGGSTIYTMFMEQGLVDKLFLTIEPLLFGTGMSLFNKELDVKIELVSERKSDEGAIFLEYNVRK